MAFAAPIPDSDDREILTLTDAYFRKGPLMAQALEASRQVFRRRGQAGRCPSWRCSETNPRAISVTRPGLEEIFPGGDPTKS